MQNQCVYWIQHAIWIPNWRTFEKIPGNSLVRFSALKSAISESHTMSSKSGQPANDGSAFTEAYILGPFKDLAVAFPHPSRFDKSPVRRAFPNSNGDLLIDSLYYHGYRKETDSVGPSSFLDTDKSTGTMESLYGCPDSCVKHHGCLFQALC